MHKHIRGQCTFITIPIDTYVEKRGMKNEKRSKFGLANGGRGKNGLYFFMCCSLPFFLLVCSNFQSYLLHTKQQQMLTLTHKTENWLGGEGRGEGANNAAADSSFIIYKFQMC